MTYSESIDNSLQNLVTQALTWADNYWDDTQHLVRIPLKQQDNATIRHGIRESVWYATGLLLRQSDGDVDRAQQALKAVLSYQLNSPDDVFHGTFLRYPDEALPQPDAIVWQDYDPNWREFIATVFICLLIEFDALLPDALQDQMREAIHLAAEGSFARQLDAEYTNIALMKVFLLDFAGQWFDNSTWRETAKALATDISQLFERNKTFIEYNSPTYYGIDLYGLALWRKYGADSYRDYGAQMEAALWRDIAAFYHAEMRNICGAYDRSYGMDMTDYIAVVGLWIAPITPPTRMPLPDISQTFDHAWDLFFAPLIALVGINVTEDSVPHFQSFQGERYLQRSIEPNRDVTAWLSDSIMIGAESDRTGRKLSTQFFPATVHWQQAEGIGWLHLHMREGLQGLAKPAQLQLSSATPIDYVFEIHTNTVEDIKLEAGQCVITNLTIYFDGNIIPILKENSDKRICLHFRNRQKLDLNFVITW